MTKGRQMEPGRQQQRPNIFLTGVIRIGKSTALNAALRLLHARRVGGFRTLSAATDIPQAIGAVYILPADGPAAYDGDHLVGIRWGKGEFTAFPAAFESAGCAILAAMPRGADIVIMDELGVMEQNAPRFCAAVLAQLDGHAPVLGVIKPMASPLLDAVRQHRRSVVLEVTPDNRDSLPDVIAGLLRRHPLRAGRGTSFKY